MCHALRSPLAPDGRARWQRFFAKSLGETRAGPSSSTTRLPVQLWGRLSLWKNETDTGGSAIAPSWLSWQVCGNSPSERQGMKARLPRHISKVEKQRSYKVHHAVVVTNRKRGGWGQFRSERCGSSRAVEATSCASVVHEQQALPRAPGIHGRTNATRSCQRIKGTDNWC